MFINEKYDKAINEVIEELIDIKKKRDDPNHPWRDYQSFHEGYALLLEELDELWEEVRKKPHKRDKEATRTEAMQIAAVAIRFMVDLT
jgi:NTP pyrophosphatase (non-canonical NTP hydrolase)